MKRHDTIVRYMVPERTNHWITAFYFILAVVSGMGFLFPSFNWLTRVVDTPQLTRIVHLLVGVIMFILSIVMFFRYWHHNLINRDDIFWAKNIRKIVVNEEIGDTGRYNFGQKCVLWAAVISLVLLLVSGVAIWRLHFAPVFSIPVIRFALMLHSFAVVASIVVIMMHIYAAPQVRGTITVMVEEWAINSWAKKHRPRWYRGARQKQEKSSE